MLRAAMTSITNGLKKAVSRTVKEKKSILGDLCIAAIRIAPTSSYMYFIAEFQVASDAARFPLFGAFLSCRLASLSYSSQLLFDCRHQRMNT